LTEAVQREWLERLEAEHENLRAALDWSLGETDSSKGLRFCGALWRYWKMRGRLTEGREWCSRALEAAGENRSAARAKALNGAGILAHLQGDYTAARGYHEESLAISREIGDWAGIATSLNSLGAAFNSQNDYASASTYYKESLTIFREIGDRSSIAGSLLGLGNIAYAQGDYDSAHVYYEDSLAIKRGSGDRDSSAGLLNNLGNVANKQGDYASASTFYEESLAIKREMGNWTGTAASLNNLGDVAYRQREYASARTYHEESLAISMDIGDRIGIAMSLEGFARLAATESRPEQAAALWAMTEVLREQTGAPMIPSEREEYDRDLAQARQALGEEAFSAAWVAGMAITKEQAIALALGEPEV
jgi:tetratricopeptide (TPR) repeat protein